MDEEKTQQTKQIISEMLEFLETGSEDEYDLEQKLKNNCNGMCNSIKKDLDDNIITDNFKEDTKAMKNTKPTKPNKSKKSRQQNQRDSQETDSPNNRHVNNSAGNNTENDSQVHSEGDNTNSKPKTVAVPSTSPLAIFKKEVTKCVYCNTTCHPPEGSTGYNQGAQNYAVYGRYLLDFPNNYQALIYDASYQNSVAVNSNLVPNCYNRYIYSGPNRMRPNVSNPIYSVSGAAPSAYYHHVSNNMQAHSRQNFVLNPANSNAYGVFRTNNMTYMARTPSTPLMYSQHNTATTNFISNSIANTVLAPSPQILYTNPMLTTPTQPYMTQYLSTLPSTSNSIQSNTVSANAAGGSAYERLSYAQILQRQLHQSQYSTPGPAPIYQNNPRVVNQELQETSNVADTKNKKSSSQPP